MKCSLLTLSTFIDGALPTERAAEVDAHLVGCPRCSAGVTTLREERDRVGSLARVRVDWESAQALLEQVGIGATGGPAPARPNREAVAVSPTRPWLSAGGGGALPWAPHRPSAAPPPVNAISEEPSVQTVDPDVQPDLPFDAAHAHASAIASPEVEAVDHPLMGAPVPWGADLQDEPAAPLQGWEADIPPYEEPDSPSEPPPATGARPAAGVPFETPVAQPVSPSETVPVGQAGSADDATPRPSVAASPSLTRDGGSPPLAPPLAPPQPPRPRGPAGPPRRLERRGGAMALVQRAADLVAVRLALSRPPGDDSAVDLDTLPPVAPQPLQPIRPAAPVPGFEAPNLHAALPVAPPVPAHPAPAPAVNSQGDSRPLTPAAARADAIRALRGEPTDDGQVGGVPDGWNAFGAAAYRQSDTSEATPPSKRPGRHLRQARRQAVPLSARLAPLASAAGLLTAAAADVLLRAGRGARAAARSLGAATRRPAGGVTAPTALPLSPRVLLAAGAAVVVFLLALLVGRGGSTATPVSNSGRTTASTSTAQGRPSTPPSAAATAAPSATAAGLSGVQTFGGGATGFTLDRVRYGVFNGAQRLVFDLSGPSGAPTTTIGFSGPTTLLIRFSGSSPPVFWAPPPSGVVTSITTVSASNGTVTVRLTLARGVTPVAFYLSGPERFVIDLH
ncbi:MAG: zf-HC2 domain-containing protein [Candidatus Dormibacteria bacterium]